MGAVVKLWFDAGVFASKAHTVFPVSHSSLYKVT